MALAEIVNRKMNSGILTEGGAHGGSAIRCTVGLGADLYRDNQNDHDMHWHHVGPLHERCAFNLLDLVGYAPSKGDKPPFHLYNVYQWTGVKVPDKTYATLPAVKRAGLAWVKSWLPSCDGKPVEWENLDTGVHFVARVNGLKIANYYYCPEPVGNWHKGFRVWFGGTYYLTDFANPSEAESAVAATWERWLMTAREKLLQAPNDRTELPPPDSDGSKRKEQTNDNQL